MTALTHLVVGPAQHGVTRYALRCAEAEGGPVVRVHEPLRLSTVPQVRRLLGGRRDAVHLHVTDHLLGADPSEAADVVDVLARSYRLTVTLHDLPQASDGRQREARTRCYARVVAAVRGVIVSSHHELDLLREVLREAGVTPGDDRLAVVPHLVDPPSVRSSPPPTSSPDVAVLGFVYPGKGHLEALGALDGLGPQVGLLALGRPSRGHDDLLEDLRARAASLRRRFVCTGWLDDDQLQELLARVAVPVVAHAHVSASGSLATWLSAGRRPVVLRNRYVEEVAARNPGCVSVVDDLGTGIAAALEDPASTWLPAGTDVGPDATAVAAAMSRLAGRWAA